MHVNISFNGNSGNFRLQTTPIAFVKRTRAREHTLNLFIDHIEILAHMTMMMKLLL